MAQLYHVLIRKTEKSWCRSKSHSELRAAFGPFRRSVNEESEPRLPAGGILSVIIKGGILRIVLAFVKITAGKQDDERR
jgi:hypothetical protein